MGLSFILAILVGGYLSNTELYPMFNSALPFVITGGLALVNLLIVQFFYQDTMSKKTRSSTFFFSGLNLPQIRFLLVIFFFFLIAWFGSLQFLSAAEIEHFQSSKEAITLTFISGGILWVIANIYFNPLLLKRFKPRQLVFLSLPLFALALLGIALSPVFIAFFLFFNLGSFSASIAWTNIITLISKYAPSNVQGRTLGFNQSVSCLATCIAPILGGILAAFGVTFIYLIYSFCVIISLLTFLLSKHLSKLETKK